MPYKSVAQQRYFHAHKKELEAQGVNVAEWDQATKGKSIPRRIGKTRQRKTLDKLLRGMKGKRK